MKDIKYPYIFHYESIFLHGFIKKSPATSYPPRQLPTKYFRRWKTLLLCSVWEQVWPFRHRRETSLALFQAIENRLKRIGSMER